MGSAERHRFNFTLSWLHGVIIISTILIMMGLLIGCCIMFSNGVENEKRLSDSIIRRDSIMEHRLSQPIILIKDSTGQSLANSQEIEERIRGIDERQSEYFADLRQESNNIINKFNAWLGFWIAILTIFGGIIPIVIQYILHHKSKTEVEKMFEDLQKKALNHQLLLTVSGVYINDDCGAIRDTEAKGILMNTMIEETYKSFQSLIEIIDNSQGYLDREGEIHLINALVQYSRLIYVLTHHSTHRQTRELVKLGDRIKDLISDITRHQAVSRDEIWQRVMDLLPNLASLRWN